MVDSTPSDYHLTYLRERWERDRSSRVFLQLAEEYRRRGLHAEALEVLQVGLTHHPGYLAAQVALGRTRMEAGHLDAATQVLEGVLRHDPTQAVAIRLLAESWLRLRNPAKAREAIDRCRLLGVPPAELQVFEERLRSLREEETLTPAFADDAPAPAMPADGALPADGQVEEDAAWAADASEAPTHVPTGWGGAPAVAERDLGEPAGSSASLPAEQEDAAIAPPAAATDDLPAAEEPAAAPETSGEPWPGFAAPAASPAAAAAAFGDVIPLPRVAAPPVALPLHHGAGRRLVRYAAEDPFPLVGATALSPAAAAIASADVFALAPPQPAVTPAAPPAAPRPWEAPAAPADAFAAADAVSAPAPATESEGEAAAETAAAEATPAEAGSAGATPADDLLAPPPWSAVAEGPAGPEACSTPSPAVEEPPAPGITEAAEDAEPLPWDDTVAAAGPAVAQIEQEERAAWQEPHEAAAAAWAEPGVAIGDAGTPDLAGPPNFWTRDRTFFNRENRFTSFTVQYENKSLFSQLRNCVNFLSILI